VKTKEARPKKKVKLKSEKESYKRSTAAVNQEQKTVMSEKSDPLKHNLNFCTPQ